MSMHRALLLLPGLALVLAGCGAEEPTIDAQNPQVVFEGAMRAVHDGDWTTLQHYLTKDARFALEKDLRRVQTNLATPRPGSPLMQVVQLRLGDDYQAEVDTAVRGGMPELLRFFVKLSPRERRPQSGPMKIDPKSRSVTLPYALSSGEERTVTLVQARGRWYVSNLQL